MVLSSRRSHCKRSVGSSDECWTAPVIRGICCALQSTSVSVFQRWWQLVYIHGLHHQPTDWWHSWSTHTSDSDSTSLATAAAAGTLTQQGQSQREFRPTATACTVVGVDCSEINTCSSDSSVNEFVYDAESMFELPVVMVCCTRNICL